MARSDAPDEPPRGNPARSGNPARRAQARPSPATPAAAQSPGKFPRRDAAGRVDTFGELLLGVLVWLAVGLVALLAIDGIAALFGQGFGGTSGWICGLLAVWLFAEEYRAWRPVPARAAVALLGVLVGGTMGAAVTGLCHPLPPLVSGLAGVTVAALVYAILWYFGVRILARRSGTD